MKFIVVLLVSCVFTSFGFSNSKGSKNFSYKNGHWFDGKKFVKKNMYSSRGVFVGRRPRTIDKEFNFRGKYIIPPFAEAHNHWVEPGKIDEYIQNYLRAGVFYIKDQANSPFIYSQIREKVNLPNSVDYTTALQGFTENGGHPYQIYLQLQQLGIFPKGWQKADFDGGALLLIDHKRDIPRSWNRLMKNKPSFIKVFLLFSEQYEKRRHNPKYKYKRGLNPKLVREIVTRAHKAGLRVSAHISTSTDFHHAVSAGVDEISHTPLVEFDDGLGSKDFLIAKRDAKRAAKKGINVISTISWLKELRSENPKQAKQAINEVVIPNLRTLKRHGVKLVVGSDQFRETPIEEIFLLDQLNLYSRNELLKIATETTSRSIFPNRKIGRLRNGYEASFLVLDQDPLSSMRNIKGIRYRFKKSILLDVPR